MKSFSTNYMRGLLAEIYTGIYFILKGYKILAWRYKTHGGEIDFIISKKNIIIFVEVKLRPTTDQALESITPKMKARISNAARYFLSRQSKGAGGISREFRFDVVAVSGFRIWHLDNAWFLPA